MASATSAVNPDLCDTFHADPARVAVIRAGLPTGATLEALAASTDGQGTVAVGSRGDLALLDADPLEFEPDSAASNGHLRGTSVALTVVDGRVTHRAL